MRIFTASKENKNVNLQYDEKENHSDYLLCYFFHWKL